jgi:predicted nucleic acid-binding protein
MTDLVLDVGALVEMLSQVFACPERESIHFHSDAEEKFITDRVAALMNKVVRSHGQFVIVASALAFVELAHKWGDIVETRFHPRQLAAFLSDPPDWFAVAAIDRELIPFLCKVPAEVVLPNGKVTPIEWTDAIHAATAYSRSQARLVTTDSKLRQIPNLVVY